MTLPDVSALGSHLGHEFADRALLQVALAHRSYCAEHPGHDSNERLELLGDSVLGMIVTDRIFRDFPHLEEGELAKVRAAVVSAETLSQVAAELALGEWILLGRGEEQSGGRLKASILSDALEAVIGAVYLDGGWDAARTLVLRLLKDRIDAAAEDPGLHDYKTRLQELAVSALDETPRYELRDEGPDHAKQFFATVLLRGAPRGAGAGSSKKQAEQQAAHGAWEWLQGEIASREAANREAHSA